MQDGEDAVDGNLSAVTIARRLDCPPETVWAALTQPERIAAWWGDYVSLEARLGGALSEVWRDEDGREVITAGRIETFEPPHRLSLTWKDMDWPAETRVTFRIEKDGDGAVLTLSHEGWDGFAAAGPALRKAHETGWRHHMDSLATLLGPAP